jgi:AsmA protein
LTASTRIFEPARQRSLALKKIVIALVVLIVAIFGGLASLPLFISAETIRTELVTRIETATGRAVRIDGPVSFSVFPLAHLSAEGVGIADFSGGPEAFSVESVSFGLSLLPLMTGNIEIYGITITRPSILIETNESGIANWGTPDAKPDTPPTSIEDVIGAPQESDPVNALAILDRLSIGRVTIAEGTLSWRDTTSGTEQRLESLDLEIRVPKLDGAGSVEGRFTRLGVEQSLELEIGEWPNPARLESIPVKLTLSSDAATLTAKGTALPGDRFFSGTIETSGESFAQFAKGLGVDLPALPAFEKFEAVARLNANASQILIDQYSINLGGIKAKGGAAIGLDRVRPGIGLKIEVDRIDTALFIGESGSGAGARPSETPASTPEAAPLDFSPLGLVDANIDFSASELLIGGVALTDLGLDVQIVDGNLNANIRSLNVSGAPGKGSLVVDSSAAVPTLSGNVEMAGLDAAGLVALAGADLPIDSGKIGLNVAFATQGVTQGSLLENLDANGSISIVDGHMSGLGIADLLGGDPSADAIDDVDAVAEFSSLTSPVTVKGGFGWRDERFAISAQGDPRAIISGASTTIEVETRSDRANFGFTGEAGLSGFGAGTFSLSAPSLRNLLAWIGQPLAPGGGFEQFSIEGAVALAEDSFSFENAAFVLDGSNGIGTGKFTFGETPNLTAGLAMKRLDITPYLVAAGGGNGSGGGGGDTAAAAGVSGGNWSQDRIGFSGLRAINANLNLKTDEIIADEITIGPSNLTVKITDGKLSAELTEMALYSGIGVGTLSIDGASTTPTLAAFFRLDSIEALGFLRDAAGFSRIEGTGALSFDIRSAGDSEAALMAALSGKGAMEFRNGAIRGINIPNMMRNLSIDTLLGWQQTGNEKTDFSQLSGTYTIENGLLTNNDLVLIGPLIRITGAGTANIPDRTLAYRVDPKIVATLEGQGGSPELEGFTVPVRVEGSWDQPRIYPEIDGILQDPQKALDQLRALGGGLFGGQSGGDRQATEGETKSVEDTIKDEAAKGLDNFLGGLGVNVLPSPSQSPQAAPELPPQSADQPPLDLTPSGDAPPVEPTPQTDPATDLLRNLLGQ